MPETEPPIPPEETDNGTGALPLPPSGIDQNSAGEPELDESEADPALGQEASIDSFSAEQRNQIKENLPESVRDSRLVEQALDRFEHIHDESLRGEMNGLFDAINNRFGLDKSTPEKTGFLEKIEKAKKAISEYTGKLGPFVSGIAAGYIFKTTARQALHLAGVNGALAAGIVGGAWGGIRAGLRENQRSSEKYFSAKAWVEHLNDPDNNLDDNQRLGIIKQLLQNSDYKNHLKERPGDAFVLLQESFTIAGRMAAGSLLNPTEANGATEDIEAYFKKASRKKLLSVCGAVGVGALQGALFSLAGYGVGHAIGQLHNRVVEVNAAMEEANKPHIAPADMKFPYVGTAAQAGNGSSPFQIPTQEPIHHMWHDGKDNAGHLPFNLTQGRFDENPDNFSTVSIETPGGSTSHQIAGEISKAIKDQIAPDMTPEQKVAFDDHVAEWIKERVSSGIIAQGQTVHVPAYEINQALAEAHISIDSAAIGKFPEIPSSAENNSPLSHETNAGNTDTHPSTESAAEMGAKTAQNTPSASSNLPEMHDLPHTKEGMSPALKWTLGTAGTLAAAAAGYWGIPKILEKSHENAARKATKREYLAKNIELLENLEQIQTASKTIVYTKEVSDADGNLMTKQWEILGLKPGSDGKIAYAQEYLGRDSQTIEVDLNAVDPGDLEQRDNPSLSSTMNSNLMRQWVVSGSPHIELWTSPFPGLDLTLWEIIGPSNNPVLPVLIKKVGQDDSAAVAWRLPRVELERVAQIIDSRPKSTNPSPIESLDETAMFSDGHNHSSLPAFDAGKVDPPPPPQALPVEPGSGVQTSRFAIIPKPAADETAAQSSSDDGWTSGARLEPAPTPEPPTPASGLPSPAPAVFQDPLTEPVAKESEKVGEMSELEQAEIERYRRKNDEMVKRFSGRYQLPEDSNDITRDLITVSEAWPSALLLELPNVSISLKDKELDDKLKVLKEYAEIIFKQIDEQKKANDNHFVFHSSLDNDFWLDYTSYDRDGILLGLNCLEPHDSNKIFLCDFFSRNMALEILTNAEFNARFSSRDITYTETGTPGETQLHDSGSAATETMTQTQQEKEGEGNRARLELMSDNISRRAERVKEVLRDDPDQYSLVDNETKPLRDIFNNYVKNFEEAIIAQRPAEQATALSGALRIGGEILEKYDRIMGTTNQ